MSPGITPHDAVTGVDAHSLISEFVLGRPTLDVHTKGCSAVERSDDRLIVFQSCQAGSRCHHESFFFDFISIRRTNPTYLGSLISRLRKSIDEAVQALLLMAFRSTPLHHLIDGVVFLFLEVVDEHSAFGSFTAFSLSRDSWSQVDVVLDDVSFPVSKRKVHRKSSSP